VIPGATQTFSKGPTQFVEGASPAFAERAEGCRIWDIDGNEYIDYALALGPMILGYANPEVDAAITKQLASGITFSLPHRLEVELAERLVDLIPCAEIARAATGRDHLLFCGYHGWHDWHIGATTRNKGVPAAVSALTHAFPYANLAALEELLATNDVAAVVLEPVGIVSPPDDYLQGLIDVAHRYGALVIFDEIITGFRLSLGGAQEYYGVAPDLATFGKAMANGMPLSAVVGKRELLLECEEVFFSMTFGGEALSLAAALATIEILERDAVIPQLWLHGGVLSTGLERLIAEYDLSAIVSCQGPFPRAVVGFTDQDGAPATATKSLFQQECIKRGVLFAGSQFISSAHSADVIDHTLAVYDEALGELKDALDADQLLERIEGRLVEPVFRKP
jgi:glutamate-1-semialdehyde 2,1-aminomutase/spore coat polysaccharide biosynthesis protein SpsF